MDKYEEERFDILLAKFGKNNNNSDSSNNQALNDGLLRAVAELSVRLGLVQEGLMGPDAMPFKGNKSLLVSKNLLGHTFCL